MGVMKTFDDGKMRIFGKAEETGEFKTGKQARQAIVQADLRERAIKSAQAGQVLLAKERKGAPLTKEETADAMVLDEGAKEAAIAGADKMAKAVVDRSKDEIEAIDAVKKTLEDARSAQLNKLDSIAIATKIASEKEIAAAQSIGDKLIKAMEYREGVKAEKDKENAAREKGETAGKLVQAGQTIQEITKTQGSGSGTKEEQIDGTKKGWRQQRR